MNIPEPTTRTTGTLTHLTWTWAIKPPRRITLLVIDEPRTNRWWEFWR